MSAKPEKTEPSQTLDRRSFFKSLGGASAAAAAAVTGSAVVAPAAAAETGGERTKARYKDSEHVKTFYRVNRY